MENIQKIVIKQLEKAIYMKTYTMHFIQNGESKSWDLLKIHDTVLIIIYNISRNVLILVKQFRPAVYFGSIPETDRKFNEEIDTKKYPPNIGIVLEFCVGIVDKLKSVEEIAMDEVLKQCGYLIKIGDLEKIAAYRSGVGAAASIQTAFYCEVKDDMKVNLNTIKDDDNNIEIVEMSVSEIKRYLKSSYIKSPPSFMFGARWFLYNKYH